MARVIRARYENGVLRPLEKLDLREGEVVEVIIRRAPASVFGALFRGDSILNLKTSIELSRR